MFPASSVTRLPVRAKKKNWAKKREKMGQKILPVVGREKKMLESQPEDALVNTVETVKAVETEETVETAETVETLETVETEETVETVEAVKTVDTVDTVKTLETVWRW